MMSPASDAIAEKARLLLVDDDQAVLRAYGAVLTRHGWAVETARDGLEAKELIQDRAFDVIVSDITMPGYGGLTFLRSVRERDLDVPVILVTGTPSVDSSIRAIEHGVFRYLLKPVPNDLLLDVVGRAACLHKLARLKRRALEITGTEGRWLGDRAVLENRFDRAKESLWLALQPVVSWRDRRVFGYEVLVRSDEAGLATPPAFIEAAERLGKVHDLGRAVRAKAADALRLLPADVHLFANLHTADLTDDDLLDSFAPLSGAAHRVVLEITERASLDGVKDLPGRVKALKAMGFRIAIDDFGAGYADLSSFTQLEPEIVKLDMTLVRGIDADAKRMEIVKSMTLLCARLGMTVVAEGVESPGERDALVELGCDLLQGHLFAPPARAVPPPVW